jgi:AraC-like DNA-binding protein
MVFTKASESTRQEYAARMNRVVDHIQRHLDDPLDLEQLASIAFFSPFHFHRLFSAWMGETIQAFVQRLRLERAAAELVFDLRKSITAIALDCGFSGSSVFARAFKEAFGVSATEWRNRKIRQTSRKEGEAERDQAQGRSELPGLRTRHKEISMMNFPIEVEVRSLRPSPIAYLRHIGPYMGDGLLFQRFSGSLASSSPGLSHAVCGVLTLHISASSTTIPISLPRRNTFSRWLSLSLKELSLSVKLASRPWKAVSAPSRVPAFFFPNMLSLGTHSSAPGSPPADTSRIIAPP